MSNLFNAFLITDSIDIRNCIDNRDSFSKYVFGVSRSQSREFRKLLYFELIEGDGEEFINVMGKRKGKETDSSSDVSILLGWIFHVGYVWSIHIAYVEHGANRRVHLSSVRSISFSLSLSFRKQQHCTGTPSDTVVDLSARFRANTMIGVYR